jgi:serine/threonine-protein kinase
VALEPSRITDFRIAGALGVGSTARVFEAIHLATGREVAIKMLEPGSQAGSELRERFAREAILLSGVQSRHVSQILGFGFERGQPFIVLERLHGETLDARLRREGPIPLTLALGWIDQLLTGVRDVHAANVVHRDLKPSNIFLQQQPNRLPVVKVIDFGVARLAEVAGSPGLTSTHHLIGSMGYMAPEQFRSAASVGFSADIYALGVVVFRMATGKLPFVSRSIEQIIRMKCEKDPPLVSSFEGAPKNPQLDWFVNKAMQRDPRVRFASVREMLQTWQQMAPSMLMPLEETDIPTSVDGLRIDIEIIEESEPPHPIPPTLAARQAPTLIDDDHEPTIPERRASFATTPDTPLLEGSRTDPDFPQNPAAIDLDIPTRNDPELRKLVERELERHRARGK